VHHKNLRTEADLAPVSSAYERQDFFVSNQPTIEKP